MMSLKNKVLDTIEEKEIAPKPEWRFTLHTLALWLSIALSIFLGALALSTIIFFSVNGDWDVLSRLPDRVSFVFFTMPYAWLIVTVVALVFAEHQYRLTKDAYRYRYSYTVLGVVIATSVLGVVFYNTGFGQMVDIRLQHLPGYNQLVNPRAAMWNMAEKGRLAGEVIEYAGDGRFQFRDHSHQIWIVTVDEEIDIPSEFLKKGKRLRVMGEALSENEFHATRILPWIPHEPDRKRIERFRPSPPRK